MPDRADVRIVLVGLGVRGRTWIEVCETTPGVELVGTVDSHPELTDASFRSLNDALTRASPDAILIATPPATHHALVTEALDHGCHVLCEKPLSEDLTEVTDLIAKAEAAHRHLLVGMNFRYLSSSQRLRELVQGGELGALAYAQFSYIRHRDGRRDDLNDYPLTMRYPMLLEQSVHHFDLLRYCYGREVEALVADSFRPSFSTYEGDCCVSVLLRFEGGVRVNYLGTWTARWNKMSFLWRSELDKGVVEQRSQFGDLRRVDLHPELARSGARFKDESDAEVAVPEELASCEPFIDDSRGLVGELVAAIREARAPVTTAKDHLETLLVVRACVESFEQRRWVSIDELR